jgi:trans-aconitate methyltransferase
LLLRHDLATSRRAIKTICKIISGYNLEAGNFYDLGCGRGTVVLAIKRKFPSFSVWGIDKNIIRIFFAKLKAWILGQKINFKRVDILKINTSDLQNADVVYTYLWYDLMPPLEEKLRGLLKKGALVITNTSNFLNWQPKETYITYPKNPDFEKLFVYKL